MKRGAVLVISISLILILSLSLVSANWFTDLFKKPQLSPDEISLTNQLFGTWSTTVIWLDVMKADVNGDGKDDVIGRESANGNWWVGVSDGTGLNNILLGAWSNAVTWSDVQVADVNGDGKKDIVGRTDSGQWWVGISNGDSFSNKLFGSWSSAVTWVDVQVADVNNDKKEDIIGRTSDGNWWAGVSDGNTINNQYLGTWSTAVTWSDIQVADINADNKDDIIGRTDSGQWWGGISDGNTINNQYLGTWSNAVTWNNVMKADVNGDNKDDIIGRTNTGQWWAGISNGNTITNQLLGTWSTQVTWNNVIVADVNGDGKDDLVGRTNSGDWWAGVSGSTNQECQDGTNYDECSLTKPLYCENGNLVDNCQICGCQDNYTCTGNGSCISNNPISDCSESQSGDTECFNGQKRICVLENKQFIWKYFNCQQGCSNGYCNEEELYQCPGSVINGLCYRRTIDLDTRTSLFENENLKISFNYTKNTRVGDIINVETEIVNKKDYIIELNYSYSIFNDLAIKENSDFFVNDNANKRGILLVLQPRQTRRFSSYFEIIGASFPDYAETIVQTNFWSSGFTEEFVSVDIFLNIEPTKDYISCGGFKFPRNFKGESGKCCNDVFYPSFQCCADSDCPEGRCIDGYCLVKENLKNTTPAMGNKRVLFISLSRSEASANPCSKSNMHPMLEGVENYYDIMAQRYLNESPDFINFNWNVYGTFNLQTLNLTESQVTSNYENVIDSVISYCQLDSKDNNDIFILLSSDFSNSWCPNSGNCVLAIGGKDVFLDGKGPTTTAHELGHVLGCVDLYSSGSRPHLGGAYQWYSSLMSSGREDISQTDNITLESLPDLQVCRGEMGWTDLDNNGVIDVIEVSHEPSLQSQPQQGFLSTLINWVKNIFS